VEAEELGGALTHNKISGVAHYRVADDDSCIEMLRELVDELPMTPRAIEREESVAPRREPTEAYDLIPGDHRQPYETEELLETILDASPFDEFQADYAPEMLTGVGRLGGWKVGVIANRRGMY
jgi:acetyl-CoA carboxylase carboxyltransferase component